MSRRDLYNLVRDLRQHLEWQAVWLGGSLPAPAEEREAFVARRAARQRAALERSLAGPTTADLPAATPTSGPTRAPARKPEPKPTPAGPALWKDDSLGARPRKTFAPAPVAAPDAAPAARAETLDEIRTDLGDCTRCGLSGDRKNIVFGVGNASARLMFVGEAPGFHEDAEGEPFVGDAGALLNKMITAMTLSRDEVYIANVIKCRPPSNRDPEPDEIAACSKFLERQVAAIQPEVIVALGKFASNLLSGNTGSLNRIRGTWQQWNGIALMPTFHPAYLLRNPAEKGPAWDDLKLVMERLGLAIPPKYR